MSYAALLKCFGDRGVGYCYWKSGRRAGAILAGASDLDLLVAQASRQQAEKAALLDCGFKSFTAVAYRDHPSVFSYLGYDEESGRICHVHLHTRLVLGSALLKNWRLPWKPPCTSQPNGANCWTCGCSTPPARRCC